MPWHFLDTASQSAFGSPLADQSNQNQIDNATMIYNYFSALGYSLNAIAALIGNAQHESFLNPAQWQNGVGSTTGAYGLWQWDPTTKYTQTYCNHFGYDRTDGDKQCEWIETQTIGGLLGDQWLTSSTLADADPRQWNVFKYTTAYTPEQLARSFCGHWERGYWAQRRATNARYWYDYFSGTPPTPPPTGAGVPIWLLAKIVKNRQTAGYIRRADGKGMIIQ